MNGLHGAMQTFDSVSYPKLCNMQWKKEEKELKFSLIITKRKVLPLIWNCQLGPSRLYKYTTDGRVYATHAWLSQALRNLLAYLADSKTLSKLLG